MSDRYSIIDPTLLPDMTVIEPVDAEGILARRMQSLKARWTEADPPYGAIYDVENEEFDPLKIGQEVGTNYQTSLEIRVNQAARDVTLVGAWGSNLDGIATRYPGGCPRLPIVPNPRPYKDAPQDWEPDGRYKKRIWLSANAFSTAGAKEAYEFWAMTAAPTLKDVTASVVKTTDGPVVNVTCLGNDDPIPSKDELLAVNRVLQRPDVKPLTDIVSVGPPGIVDATYAAKVWLFPGPDATSVKGILEKRLAAYLDGLRYLGKDHTDDGYSAALRIEGVTHSSLRLPAKTIRVDDTGFVRVVGTPVVEIMKERLE